jgi:hypothetical protein
MHGLRQVIVFREPNAGEIAALGDRLEIGIPETVEAALVIDKIDQASTQTADGRDIQLARPPTACLKG